MVSQITYGRRTNSRGEPFRRRRPLPAIVVGVVLAVIAAAVWISVGSSGDTTKLTVSCPAPPAGADGSPAPPLNVVDPGQFGDVKPAPLGATAIRVLNASGVRAQAQTVSSQLTDLGFKSAAVDPYADDTVYTSNQLACTGQIRFGESGRANAAALWVAAPCSELILDARTDNSADLALGTEFPGIDPNADAQSVLDSLKSAPADRPDGGANPALLAAVHQTRC